MLDKKRLQELVKEVDPNEQLDKDVEELLLHIADDFIEQVRWEKIFHIFITLFEVLFPYTFICNTDLTKLT